MSGLKWSATVWQIPVLFYAVCTSLGCTAAAQTKRVDFAFIGKLHAQPKNIENYHAPKGVEVQGYKFDVSRQEVVSAATEELGPPAYEDAYETIFVRDTPAGRVRLTVYLAGQRGVAATGGAILAGPHSVIGPVGDRNGWRPDIPSQDEDFFPHDNDLEVTGGGYSCEKEITWGNTSDSEITAVLDDFQLRQCDPFEPIPFTVKVPSLSKVTSKFTFPSQADKPNSSTEPYDGGSFIFHWVTAGGKRHEDQTKEQEQAHDLNVSVQPSNGDGRALMVYINRDNTFRQLELKSAKVELSGRPQLNNPGPWLSKPGAGLKIPFAMTSATGAGDLVISFDYRVVPNKRWRNFTRTDHPTLAPNSAAKGPTSADKLSLPPTPPEASRVPNDGRAHASFLSKDGEKWISIQGRTVPLNTDRIAHSFKVGPGLYVSAGRNPSHRSVVTLFRDQSAIDHFDLYAAYQGWLKSDDTWGSHKLANQMRYLDAIAFFDPQISEAIPEPDGSALAVVDVPGESIASFTLRAELVRLNLKPFTITHLKSLEESPEWGNASRSVRRMYPFGDKVYVVDGKTLWQWSRDGVIKKWADLPFGTVGLVSGRYLIMWGLDDSTPNQRKSKVLALDLATNKLRTLDDRPQEGESAPFIGGAPSTYEECDFVLLQEIVPQNKPGERYDGRNYLWRSYAINVKTGVKTVVPGNLHLVGDFGFQDSREEAAYRAGGDADYSNAIPPGGLYLLVYSLKNGRLVQRLREQ